MPLVELHRFSNPVEAELARLRLGAAGIESVIFDVGAYQSGLYIGIRLMVDDEDEAEAKRVLAEEGEW